MILTLAWRNLWRLKRRTIFSLSAIAFTCAVVVCLASIQAGSYMSMIQTYTGLLDGYAQIQNPDYLNTPAMRETFQLGSLRNELAPLPQGVHASERGVAYALLNSDTRSLGVQILGVAPQAEGAVSTLPSRIAEGRFLQGDDDIVLGESLARNLHVGVGDSLTLLGVARDGSLAADGFVVAGLFRAGVAEVDRQLAEIPLARFDRTFAMQGARHAVVLNGHEGGALRRAIDRLRPLVEAQGLALRDWTELQPGLYAAIQMDIVGAILLYSVLIAVVVLSLLNTVLMSVLERTREFGMMMALGVRPGLLGRIVWLEIGLTALLGVGLGMALGSLLTLWLRQHGIEFDSVQAIFKEFGMSSTIYPQLTPVTVLAGPVVIALALGLTGLFPVIRIRRLDTLESMRGA